MSIWEYHLLPQLTCKDAARLVCTCKVLNGVVREQLRDLGNIEVDKLSAALTTFPRARAVALDDARPGRGGGEEPATQWLCFSSHGKHLEVVTVENDSGPAKDLVHTALQQGALPSLKTVSASLKFATHRASLTQGLLRAMLELRVTLEPYHNGGSEAGAQLEALGLVRQLPALAKLRVRIVGRGVDLVQWPAFIPLSLKALHIDVAETGALSQSLLGALPGMLGASGATLDRLEVLIPCAPEYFGEALVHVAQALRSCSSTLRSLRIMTSVSINTGAEGFAGQVEPLPL
jgi:hypothetical protein